MPQNDHTTIPNGSTEALPFGDPCPRCGAASAHADERDRVCSCTPCDVCAEPTGSTCAYCKRSLGCGQHGVSIERHCETYCLASAEQRATIDSALDDEAAWARWVRAEQLAALVRAETPQPWPVPVPPFDPPYVEGWRTRNA